MKPVKMLTGVQILDHAEFFDERGWFKYVFQQSGTADGVVVAQVNHSFSRENVLRGIHVEPWTKLIYIVAGKANVVVVNLDRQSPEFALYMRIELGDFDGGRKAVVVPEGFGNGFFTHQPTHYLNFVSREFSPDNRRGVRWDDPSLSIDWGNEREPIVSEADAHQPNLPTFLEMSRQSD